MPRRSTVLPFVWILAGCTAGADVATDAGPGDPDRETCRQLVAAEPADWPQHWRAVHGIGTAATPHLIRALRDNPDGAGAQAAVHSLGQLGGADARRYLLEALANGGEIATEAALSLGKLGGAEPVEALRGIVRDKAASITTRAAAAAALIERGEARSILPFLRAVFLAAAPGGADSSRAQGISTGKTRWAHERYMIIEAFRARYGGETFGLDEDGSWPALRQATETMTTVLTSRK